MKALRAYLAISLLLAQLPAALAAEPLLERPLAPLGRETPVMPCTGLAGKALTPKAVIVDATEQQSGQDPSWCRVTATVRTSSSDSIKIWIGLPLTTWNGRFLGTGGGGLLGGSPANLADGIAAGFVTASTDAGHSYLPGKELPTVFDGSFALNSDGSFNQDAEANFAHRGIHEMTEVAKAATALFYGTGPKYSYFVGCSTGGRQGQSEIQRYPADYNGALSGAPAINWTHFLPAALWAKTVMNERHRLVAQCKMEAARVAAIAHCDKLDGMADGIMGRPDLCRFSAAALIGKQTPCGVITTKDAAVIDRIWKGPRRRSGHWLWFGLPKGADFSFDTGDVDARVQPITPSTYDGSPSPIAIAWAKYFVLQNPKWSPSNLSYASFERLFDRSVAEHAAVFDTSNPKLKPFFDRGGKTIIWHGLADSNFPAEGTIKYVQAIRRTVGVAPTDGSLRFYLAPGVGHCGGGRGPVPVGLLDSLIAWVEKSEAPETVSAEVRDGSGPVEAHWRLVPYRGDLAKTLAESHSIR